MKSCNLPYPVSYTHLDVYKRQVYTGKEKGLIVDYIGIKKNMNLALKKYTNFESDEFEGVEQSITIVKDQLDVLAQMFHNFNSTDYFNGSPKEPVSYTHLDVYKRQVPQSALGIARKT